MVWIPRTRKRSEVHDAFSMGLAGCFWLFEGTIETISSITREGISDERVIEASKAVGDSPLYHVLPGWLRYRLDDTVTLSVGQNNS